MGNLLVSSSTASKKSTQITEVDRAILSLKTQRKKLEDQSKLVGMNLKAACPSCPPPPARASSPTAPQPRTPSCPSPPGLQFEQRMDQQLKVARDLLATQKKDRALLALKKRKLNEHQLEQLQKLLVNVEAMVRRQRQGGAAHSNPRPQQPRPPPRRRPPLTGRSLAAPCPAAVRHRAQQAAEQAVCRAQGGQRGAQEGAVAGGRPGPGWHEALGGARLGGGGGGAWRDGGGRCPAPPPPPPSPPPPPLPHYLVPSVPRTPLAGAHRCRRCRRRCR
jgi:hypothetical protein